MTTNIEWRDEGHFLFCANDLYAQHLAACMVSLLENSSLKKHDICVVGKFEDASVSSKLQELADRYENTTLRIINFLPPDDMKLPTRMHWTADTFSRFWVRDFFGPTVKRVLYLDSDMIIRRDVRRLWECDLKGKMFGAVSIPGSDRAAALSIPKQHDYFNNGVLLFDMEKWHTEQPLKTLIPYIEQNVEDLPFLDQDALNACYYHERAALDYRWNMIVPFTWKESFIPLPRDEQREIVIGACIVHYNGRSKPWHYINDHPYKADYWRYVRMTPWRDAKESGKSFPNWLKKIFNAAVPQSFREWLWRIRGNET